MKRKSKPAGKSAAQDEQQQKKIRAALKEANESWWILETHVGLLAAAARGDELPTGVAAETIGWHSHDVCDEQIGRLCNSLNELQKLAGIDDPLFADEGDDKADARKGVTNGS
jgi:hypothetical protein